MSSTGIKIVTTREGVRLTLTIPQKLVETGCIFQFPAMDDLAKESLEKYLKLTLGLFVDHIAGSLMSNMLCEASLAILTRHIKEATDEGIDFVNWCSGIIEEKKKGMTN
ncbi:MAG: hypothetical protein Q7S03_03120 [bacterium]|nr:hypothetical protein [bacterium]